MPSALSLPRPRPSLRQQRTASPPAPSTSTVLSVKTPSKSKTTRRTRAPPSLRAGSVSTASDMIQAECLVLGHRALEALAVEVPVEVRSEPVAGRLECQIALLHHVSLGQVPGGDDLLAHLHLGPLFLLVDLLHAVAER